MLTRSAPSARPAGATGPAPSGRSLTRILAATDGAPDSEAALVLAWTVARRAQARLDVLTVHQPLPAVGAEFAPPADEPELERALRQDLRERVERQMRHAGVAPPPEGLLVRTGWPGKMIVSAAEETGAGLIVMGLRPHGIVQRLLGPETALEVARSARVPVLAVANGLRWLPPRAVVAVDFSDSSARAAQAAIDLLGGGGAVVLAHVTPRASIPFAAPSSWEETIPGGTAGRLQEFARRLAIPAGVTVQAVTLRGSPAQEILSLAERTRAELIAAGSHGRSAAGRMLLGSVSTALLRGAGCSVLVAPEGGR